MALRHHHHSGHKAAGYFNPQLLPHQVINISATCRRNHHCSRPKQSQQSLPTTGTAGDLPTCPTPTYTKLTRCHLPWPSPGVMLLNHNCHRFTPTRPPRPHHRRCAAAREGAPPEGVPRAVSDLAMPEPPPRRCPGALTARRRASRHAGSRRIGAAVGPSPGSTHHRKACLPPRPSTAGSN